MDDNNTSLKNMFFTLYIDYNLCFSFMNNMCFSTLGFKSKIDIPFLISFQIKLFMNIDKIIKKFHITCETCVATQTKIMTFKVLSQQRKKSQVTCEIHVMMQTKTVTLKVSSQ